MSELGRLLSEARNARQLTLADAEAKTRIRQKYLAALETGDWASLPRGTVARGFVRTYAAYLGLNEEESLATYARESGDSVVEIEIAEPGKPRLVDYRPLEVELTEYRTGGSLWPWLAALVIVALLGVGGYWWFNRDRGWNPLAALLPKPTATATLTPTPWVVTATPLPPSPTVPAPTPTSDLLTLPVPTEQPTITPTPRPTATPELVASISLEMSVKQLAWVRVVVDGQTEVEENLAAGRSFTFDAMQSVTVRTGNAAGVSLVLNGEDLGSLGGVSQVVERTWVVSDGGITETAGGTLTAEPTTTPTATPAG